METITLLQDKCTEVTPKEHVYGWEGLIIQGEAVDAELFSRVILKHYCEDMRFTVSILTTAINTKSAYSDRENVCFQR